MPIQHHEPPPTALAHGPAKANDIERVREEVATLEERQAGRAARYWQRVMLKRAKERRATRPSR